MPALPDSAIEPKCHARPGWTRPRDPIHKGSRRRHSAGALRSLRRQFGRGEAKGSGMSAASRAFWLALTGGAGLGLARCLLLGVWAPGPWVGGGRGGGARCPSSGRCGRSVAPRWRSILNLSLMFFCAQMSKTLPQSQNFFSRSKVFAPSRCFLSPRPLKFPQ